MDQVTQTKILFRREQWKKIIAECQESGLPVKTWCDRNGFKEQSYYYSNFPQGFFHVTRNKYGISCN